MYRKQDTAHSSPKQEQLSQTASVPEVSPSQQTVSQTSKDAPDQVTESEYSPDQVAVTQSEGILEVDNQPQGRLDQEATNQSENSSDLEPGSQ
jgi:hypothetical protein